MNTTCKSEYTGEGILASMGPKESSFQVQFASVKWLKRASTGIDEQIDRWWTGEHGGLVNVFVCIPFYKTQ